MSTAAAKSPGASWGKLWPAAGISRRTHELTLDPENPGAYQSRISALSGLQDVNKADLTAFQSKGGKVLIAHGASDALVSTRATAQ